MSQTTLFLLVISFLNVNAKFQESRPRCCPSTHSDTTLFSIPSKFNVKPRLGYKNRESPHCWNLYYLTPNIFFWLETKSCFIKPSPFSMPPLGQPLVPQFSHHGVKLYLRDFFWLIGHHFWPWEEKKAHCRN